MREISVFSEISFVKENNEVKAVVNARNGVEGTIQYIDPILEEKMYFSTFKTVVAVYEIITKKESALKAARSKFRTEKGGKGKIAEVKAWLTKAYAVKETVNSWNEVGENPQNAVCALEEAIKEVEAALKVAESRLDTLVVPTDDTVVPVETPVVPTDDTVVPTDDTVVPTDDTVVPTDDTVVPTDDTVVPADDTVVPTDDDVVLLDEVAESALALGLSEEKVEMPRFFVNQNGERFVYLPKNRCFVLVKALGQIGGSPKMFEDLISENYPKGSRVLLKKEYEELRNLCDNYSDKLSDMCFATLLCIADEGYVTCMGEHVWIRREFDVFNLRCNVVIPL